VRVNIVTPVRPGGPYYVGRQLSKALNQRGIHAVWTHSLLGTLTSPLVPKVDLTHCLGVPMFTRFKPWKGPLIFSVRGYYHLEPTIWRFFVPRTIREADAITLPTQRLKESLQLDRGIVIPNAVDPEEFNPVTHGNKRTINLVTVTELSFPQKAKGIIDIAKTLSEVQSRGAKFNYRVIGSGRNLAYVREAVKEYDISIEFTGFVNNPKQVLETSDIFLYCSYLDVFPIVILEAMATGLPVLTNDFGGVSEIIENEVSGYIVKNNDEYLERLMSLLGDYRLRERIGQNAREKVQRDFNWQVVINSFISLYKSTLAKSAS
jgi:glycosyltransferase involved in cell wall biosynthesis